MNELKIVDFSPTQMASDLMRGKVELDPVPQHVLDALSQRLLGADGRLRLMPAREILSEDPLHLRMWLHQQARYLLPTQELVEWLREQIGGRRAIEVCSGNADLAFLLGIRGTDSFHQTDYLGGGGLMHLMSRQPPTRPTPEIMKMEANEAVQRLHPQVVIGAWVTRKFIAGKDVEGVSDASIFGPVEEKIIHRAPYIHIGADHVHCTKTALSLPHEEHRFPWIVSRANFQNPDANVIYVWKSQ